MATEKKVNEKKQRLMTLLREMFQLDQPDLDFGLYRIMHAKRTQVEAFLESEFDQLIDKVFVDRGARHEEDAKKDYEAARQQAIEFGAPDPDAAPKVQQARARYDATRTPISIRRGYLLLKIAVRNRLSCSMTSPTSFSQLMIRNYPIRA